jgi:hypothetical protein
VFPLGTQLSLAATAENGSGFDGWGGACSGTSTCSFSATTDQTVSAAFDLPDFSMNITPPTSPTIVAGGIATFTVAVGELGGFANPVTLICMAPNAQGVTCAFSTTTIKPGGTATLTVRTSGPSGTLEQFPWRMQLRPLYAASLSLPALAMLGIKRSRSRRHAFALMCLVVLAIFGLQLGCSGGNGTSNGPITPAGSYIIGINASAGTGLQHSSSVSVNVH